MSLFGAIEAGGTKFVCGLGTAPQDLRLTTFPTSTPANTLDKVIDYFRKEAGAKLDAVGIGAFGPVDLRPESPTFGFITSTPKGDWQQFDLAGTLQRELDVPIGFDTDVNAAAAGEARWGAGRGIPDFVYLTVGTGIGGGAMVNGELIHGLLHPEMGHIRIPHLPEDPFPGKCPYHKDCLEGLASGPAMEARWGTPAPQLASDHPAWNLEARYLAMGLASWVCTLSPERILLGGGVMQQKLLFPMIRRELLSLLNGYIRVPAILDRMDSFVVPPELGTRAGVLGALVLAEHIYRNPSARIGVPLAGADAWR